MNVRSLASHWLVAVALVAIAACGDESATTALFALDAPRDDFYALPFPNDLRRSPDDRLDLSEFPTNSFLMEQYRDAAAASLDGFGLNATIYVRFSDGIDSATLPTPDLSRLPEASVYLVNIDKASPRLGEKIPVITTFRPTAGQTIGANSLAIRPYPGFPLDEGTTYAAIVTDLVRAADGSNIVAAPDFIKLRNGIGGPELAMQRYAPLRDFIASSVNSDMARVICATVFTTQTFTHYAKGLRAAVAAATLPTATNITKFPTVAGYTIFEGSYDAPNFQRGTVPYRNAGGDVVLDGAGLAVTQRIETLRFALTVPDGPVPADGFPFAIIHHGTGGNYRSGIDDGTAVRLTDVGIATISTDQVLHGPRNPGGSPDIDFYNLANPLAARDNALQGYADAFAMLRLINALQITDETRQLTFDANRAMFFGHSQGGQTGPGFVAFEPSLKGAVLSGTGGVLYLSLLLKTKPLDIPGLVASAIRDEPLDNDNPSLALVQMFMERADPVNYAPLMVRQATLPRSILVTEGFGDNYTPNLSTEAFATSLGADLLKSSQTRPIEGLTLRGRSTRIAPFAGYTITPAPPLPTITSVLAQYRPPGANDGHFVVFDVPDARKQTAQFLGTLSATGTATLVAP